MDEFLKMFVCAGLAVACFSAPVWVPAWAEVAAAEAAAEAEVQPEDEFCSGAAPDCPSHYEVWNTLPPSYGKETSL